MSYPEGLKYWRERDSKDNRRDWRYECDNWLDDYKKSVEHPHRSLIIDALRDIPAASILEVGCNTGPNLYRISEEYEDTKLAGIDVNRPSILAAREFLRPHIDLKVANVTGIPHKDDSYDVVISDAVLLYVGPRRIKKALDELDRVAKKAIILIEWDSHSIKGKLKDFHWTYNYKNLLGRRGFKVTKTKITKKHWPTESWSKNGYLFKAVR